MPSLRGQTQRRAKQLSTKLLSSPVLPILGYSKVAETIVAGGPTANWIVYSVLVTALWVFADDIRRRAEDLGEAAQDAVDDA